MCYLKFMCGFIGFVSDVKDNNISAYQNKLSIYLEKLKNRGPDFSQQHKFYYKNKIIHVGFARLAIQDLKTSSNKIFYNNNYAILFNGEVYNCAELKKEFLNEVKLETSTDTELLFKLLQKYGTTIVKKLKGIFSIVFINLKIGKIFCIRDVTGTKPLYFSKKDTSFFFSSEAWYLYSLSQKKINYNSLNHFFNFGFSHETSTLIDNVNKVTSREILEFNINNNTYKNTNYFELEREKTSKLPVQEEINNLITRTIKYNLITDTKVGTFLSGGLDSTTVTLIAKKFNNQVEGFTTFFLPTKKYEKFNVDYKFSSQVAKEYGIKLNVHYVESENDLYSDFLKVTDYLDEPISNLNFLNTYWQTKMAKEKGIKVILTGDGADELFCGYDRYYKAFLAKKLGFLDFFSDKIKIYNNCKSQEIPSKFYSIFNNIDDVKIFKNVKNNINLSELNYFSNCKFNNLVDYMNYFDLRYWLSNESNYKLDKCSMINSIEARVPFQDVELINKLFFINNKNKFKFNDRKFLLKKNDIVPNYIKKRPKTGWFSPDRIFLDSNLNKIIETFFIKKDINEQNIFNYEELMKFFNSYYEKGFLIKRQIVTTILFQIWYKKVLSLE